MIRRISNLYLLLIFTVFLGACAGLMVLKNVLIDCAAPEIAEIVGDIAKDVQCALTGGAMRGDACVIDASIDWHAELDELKTHGKEALACAVASAGKAFATKVPLFASAPKAIWLPAQRASDYLQELGVQVKNVK